MADSVNLYASSVYGRIQNQEIARSPAEMSSNVSGAKEFQNLVEVNFNNYANLSPSQILAKISQSIARQTSTSTAFRLDLSNTVSSELAKVREVLSKQEKQAQKASIGEANLIELMTATTEATALLNTLVSIKDEAKNAWDKITSMQI